MKKKQIILTIDGITNIAELRDAINRIMENVPTPAETVYVEDEAGEAITLRLIENTLTDDSQAYDVRVSR